MKIAIVIPNYNSIKYLSDAINSALSQDYENYDIHIYDNGSTDGSYEMSLEFEKEHDNITVHQVPNIYKHSYREAVDHSFQNLDADYITFLSADDYLSTSYISKCMKIISHNPEKIKCIQSGITGVKDGAIVQKQVRFYKNIEEFKNLCMSHSPVNTPSVIYHKSLYPLMNWTPHGGQAHRHSDIPEAGAGDYDIFCGFADNGVFIYPVNTCLGYYYRWHSDQCTWGVHKDPIKYDKIIQDYWRNKWTL